MPCPLPGHTGVAYLDTPDGDPDQDLRLKCSCQGRWRSLGEVRAAIAYGSDDGGRPYKEGGRSNVELRTWTQRLLYDVGAFAPVPIRLPALPADAGESIVALASGFELLVGLRWADGERWPLPYAVRFARAWCELRSLRVASKGLGELRQLGVIREVDRSGLMPLYLPGESGEPGRQLDLTERRLRPVDGSQRGSTLSPAIKGRR